MCKSENGIHDSRSVLLICTYCYKRKNASGYWDHEDNFDSSNTEVRISHGICPECLRKQFPDEFASMCKEGKIELKEKNTSDNRVLYGCFLQDYDSRRE
jgi:hypothetical protein